MSPAYLDAAGELCIDEADPVASDRVGWHETVCGLLAGGRPTPDDPVGIEAFAIIPDAMKVQDPMGRVVISKQERVIALEPFEKGLQCPRLGRGA